MRAITIALFSLIAQPAAAVFCEALTHQNTAFTVCTVDVTVEDLRLFHSGSDGTLYGGFAAVEGAEGTLSFAMNAGMYHEDRSPVGHYVEDGREVMRLITSDGPGNFGLLPNGVLCLTDDSARVIETFAFQAEAPTCRDVTQSGPMLVIDGQLHPRFIDGSDSRLIRNGVGTSPAGDLAIFAIADEPVNFHDFGTLFRDVLGTPNALFLDGNISRLHAPSIGRSDSGFTLGPIVGVLE